MTGARLASTVLLSLLVLVAGCATRPVNPPLAKVDPTSGYRFVVGNADLQNQENLVVLAFSGGGTRAAAFSYGVLEALRDTEVVLPNGAKTRLLDKVDVITGVSGGSFTALAYGLYGEKLFDFYEAGFLKRNVQGELIERFINPVNWSALWSATWGRSEMAAQLYDEVLFHGATFADLGRGNGPLVIATATDISSGARFGFNQTLFDVMCSDLDQVPLSRAAAASSAVPFALSPVTLNNYGGSCKYVPPPAYALFMNTADPPRPAARAIRHIVELESYSDGKLRPFIHLVDGGLSDNLGMRGVLEVLEEVDALHSMGKATPLDKVRRIVVVVVNSLSVPDTHWDASERAPGDVALLIKATGVPIDHYSYDAIELLRDMMSRWNTLRRVRQSTAFTASKDPATAALINVPDIDLYAIDVSFKALRDPVERAYLNQLPTSFVLPAEAVDRLRQAAATILRESPDFKRLAADAKVRVLAPDAKAH